MTKAAYNKGRQAGNPKRSYLRFLGFFGVYGSGGVFSIFRSNASVRRMASSRGSNSIDLSSAACCAADGFGLFMGGILRRG
jgi:hypothetical protein